MENIRTVYFIGEEFCNDLYRCLEFPFAAICCLNSCGIEFRKGLMYFLASYQSKKKKKIFRA